MRKAVLFALMMTLCMPLGGCGGNDAQNTEQIQTEFQTIAAAEAEAELTCHYGEEARTYTLQCSYTPEESVVTVKEPTELADVAATFSGDALTLSYQDIMLDAGTYSDTDISPLWAVPGMLRAIGGGYPLEVCREDVDETPCLRATFEVTQEDGGKILYAVWFDEKNTPVRGEITVEDQMVYAVTFTEFTTEEPSDGTAAAENMGGDRS